MSERWLVLGFTSDAIVGAMQHTRLAEACFNAWTASGRPPAFRIIEAAGEGEHIIRWYINEAAAALLDLRQVVWRSLLVGEQQASPDRGRDLLQPDGQT